MTTDEKNTLTFRIEYKNTIPLIEFKDILDGLNNQFKKHLLQIKDVDKNEILLIKEIRQGSIHIQLISSVIPMISN
jgi:predicted LPLAT superfamily acyltransferase